jgi:addiction module HigA family antidote
MKTNKLPPIHPGEILREEFMKPRDLSQNALARALNVPPRRINEIVLEKRGITADTALRLARYFGTSAELWTGLQADYDLRQARVTKRREPLNATLNRWPRCNRQWRESWRPNAKTRWLPRRHSQHSGKPMKTKLTQRRIKARKSSACGLCQPWKQGWMKTVRDIRHAQRAQQQLSEIGF